MATVDDKKIIFSMVGVSKTIRQTNKQVLKNIYLSFFYGAKIGIIGLNGSKAKWYSRRGTAWDICLRNRSWIRPRP